MMWQDHEYQVYQPSLLREGVVDLHHTVEQKHFNHSYTRFGNQRDVHDPRTLEGQSFSPTIKVSVGITPEPSNSLETPTFVTSFPRQQHFDSSP